MRPGWVPALLAAVLALAGGCAAAQTKLQVGYAAVLDSVAPMIAEKEGFFQKRGIDVDLVWVVHGGTQIEALMSNSLQIADVAPPLLVQGVDNGADVVAIAGGSVNLPGKVSGTGLVARTGSNIHRAKDLVGKKVGEITLAPGTTGLIFEQWLVKNGVDPKQVNMVEVNYPNMNDMMKSGIVDATLPAEPFLTRIVDAGTGYLVADFQRDVPQVFPSMIWITTGDFAREHPDWVKSFKEASDEAVAFANEHPEAAREIFGSYVKLPPEALKVLHMPNLASDLTLDELQFWVDLMGKLNLLQGKVETRKLLLE